MFFFVGHTKYEIFFILKGHSLSSSSLSFAGHTKYEIKVTVGSVEWSVHHRYKDFEALHQLLSSNHGMPKHLLPPKKLIGNKDPAFIEKRRLELETYLQVSILVILSISSIIIKHLLPSKKLIGNKDPAFIEKRRLELETYLQVSFLIILMDNRVSCIH